MEKKIIDSLNDLLPVSNYLNRIGAESNSFKRAVITTPTGKYSSEKTIITFSDKGEIKITSPHNAPIEEYQPTDAETKAIEEAFNNVKLPTLQILPSLGKLPEGLEGKSDDDIFTFKNIEGEIIMLQLRVTKDDGSKYFLPFTFWDDQKWRTIEPTGLLPLWGLEKVKDFTTVFIHEGAKSARFVQSMIEAETPYWEQKLKDHPWANRLKHAAHLGWIGGAPSPYRTDWAVLNKAGVKRVYIVSDNDALGRRAVSMIAEKLQIVTYHLQFTGEWPPCFDLADEFPAKMFKEIQAQHHFIGPKFEECLHPATWMTNIFVPEKGKPIISLRDHAKGLWKYVDELEEYMCLDFPALLYKSLNRKLSAFSHTPNIEKYIDKHYEGERYSLCYRPDKKEIIITDNGKPSINRHVPSNIKSETGSIKPFIEFLESMFTIEEQRNVIAKWCRP